MPELVFENTPIEYSIVRSRRRTIGIEITADCRVLVRAPARAAERRIDRLVRDKSPWILKNLLRMSTVRRTRRFIDGELLPYRGESYALKVALNRPAAYVELMDGELRAYVASADSPDALRTLVKEALLRWYRERAGEVLAKRVPELATQTGLVPARVRITNQAHRWGSCSAKRSLNLNWKLVMAPPEVADYVIVHELCHIEVRNHSKKFWDFLGSLVPDYQAHRKWLRENGPSLDL